MTLLFNRREYPSFPSQWEYPTYPTSPLATSAIIRASQPLCLPAELADVGVGEAMLAVTIPERPGTFIDFLETALNGFAIQVTEFKYRWAAGCAEGV